MRCFALGLLTVVLATTLHAAEPWSGAVTTAPATNVDLTLTLADGKTATMRVYSPKAATAACPVVIFSHGLAGSKEGYGFLGKRWAEHGYVAIHPDHPGSDTAAFRGKPLAEIGPALTMLMTHLDAVRFGGKAPGLETRRRAVNALATLLQVLRASEARRSRGRRG